MSWKFELVANFESQKLKAQGSPRFLRTLGSQSYKGLPLHHFFLRHSHFRISMHVSLITWNEFFFVENAH